MMRLARGRARAPRGAVGRALQAGSTFTGSRRIGLLLHFEGTYTPYHALGSRRRRGASLLEARTLMNGCGCNKSFYTASAVPFTSKVAPPEAGKYLSSPCYIAGCEDHPSLFAVARPAGMGETAPLPPCAEILLLQQQRAMVSSG